MENFMWFLTGNPNKSFLIVLVVLKTLIFGPILFLSCINDPADDVIYIIVIHASDTTPL